MPLGGAARIKLAAAGKLDTFLGLENGHGQLQTGREKIKMMISNTSVRGEDFHTEKGFGFHVAVSFYLARKTMKLFLLELDISTLSQDKHLLSCRSPCPLPHLTSPGCRDDPAVTVF